MKHLSANILLCSLLICNGCDNNHEPYNNGYDKRMPLTVRATAAGFAPLPVSPETTTRIPQEDGLVTRFTAGDAIGLFAIKDKAIADGANNIRLTYTPETDEWKTANGDLYWYEGTSYIAYYPYKKDITIDPTQTEEMIVGALAAAMPPAADQSDAGKYAASDLMIATGSPDTGNESTGRKTLNLSFAHQFTLLILEPQIHVTCIEPADAGFTYRNQSTTWAPDTKARQVTMNGVKACKMDNGTFRAIIAPQEKGQIQCSYSTDNVILNEEKTVTAAGSTTAFNAGECHTLKINSLIPGPGSLIRPLAPGDFVFQGTDGIEVYPGDGLLTDGKIPEYQQAIGMVITCTADKLTDSKCNENNWNHAYVMALDSIGTGRWGDDNVDEAIDNFNTEVRVDLNMNGYSETETMLEHHADKENFTTVYTALSILVKYRQKDNIPNNSRSPWFIPSIGQWCDMLKNICGKDPMTFSRTSIAFEEFYKYGTETLDKLNAQLGKAGRSARKLSADKRRIYQTSTEFNRQFSWIIIWGFLDDWDRIGIKGYNKSAGYLIYPFFAF